MTKIKVKLTSNTSGWFYSNDYSTSERAVHHDIGRGVITTAVKVDDEDYDWEIDCNTEKMKYAKKMENGVAGKAIYDPLKVPKIVRCLGFKNT